MLQYNPDLTQREVAQALGLSTSGLNYCLKALIDKGWVKVQNFSHSKNKFGYFYVLTPLGISQKVALAASFLMGKMKEYEDLKTDIDDVRGELAALCNALPARQVVGAPTENLGRQK